MLRKYFDILCKFSAFYKVLIVFYKLRVANKMPRCFLSSVRPHRGAFIYETGEFSYQSKSTTCTLYLIIKFLAANKKRKIIYVTRMISRHM